MDDADDLFGGLPAVSNANNAPPAPADPGASSSAAAKTADVDANNKNDPRPKPPAQGEEADTTKAPEKRKAGASLVSSLGTAGTAMAFVPQAIRKKKKVSNQQPKPLRPQVQQVVIKQTIAVEQASDVSQMGTSSKAPGDVNDEASTLKTASSQNENTIDATKIESRAQTGESIHDNNDAAGEPYLENEPESLRLLHASVTHPYDPHFPNDYLAYRERKKTEQVRKDLQRSALQRLDAQEKMRKKIEEERRRIMESGDLDKIVESRGGEGAAGGGGVGRGRGRGRGVANLPAWLVKKQQEQQKAAGAATGSEQGQFDKSSQ